MLNCSLKIERLAFRPNYSCNIDLASRGRELIDYRCVVERVVIKNGQVAYSIHILLGILKSNLSEGGWRTGIKFKQKKIKLSAYGCSTRVFQIYEIGLKSSSFKMGDVQYGPWCQRRDRSHRTTP